MKYLIFFSNLPYIPTKSVKEDLLDCKPKPRVRITKEVARFDIRPARLLFLLLSLRSKGKTKVKRARGCARSEWNITNFSLHIAFL